jgi:hypothetical protein
MSSIDRDLDLRNRLAAYARSRGLERELAEDLAGEAWLRTRRRLGFDAGDDPVPYAFRALRTLMVDQFAHPERMLAKRIDLILARAKGAGTPEKGAIDSWPDGGRTLVGLSGQRRTPPHDGPVEGIALRDFLYGEKGLGGTDPRTISTRETLERFFAWFGRPMERTALVALFGPCLVAKVQTVPLDPDFDLAVEPAEPTGATDGLWAGIVGLPSSRMRAAILLAMEEPLLELIRPHARQQLPAVIEDWTPPPPLETVPLPVDDQMVAERLGTTKGNLQVLRNRARKMLRAAFGDRVDGAMVSLEGAAS